ncbi:hypothetical protein [Streptomyces violaceusniger]|uniref:hypothetical protein n=1 Tax=Streptomyces violaceusniger TaxID=68280 RepID=UPI0018CC7342|nr:hypothetical protein [Streptomyces violaceusniger]
MKADLPTQYSGLMPKGKDLGVLRGGRPAQQEEAAQQSAEDQAEQSQTHDH